MAFKYSEYLITPSDVYRGILHMKNNMRRRDLAGLVILALVFSYTNHLGWQIDSSIFFCFFVALFFWNLDSRISIGLALIFLISCPFLLIAYNDYNFLWGEDWAETAAVWAYYLLVFGVVKQMWDFRKERGDADTNTDTNAHPHPDPLPNGARGKNKYWIPASAGMTNAGAREKIDTNADTQSEKAKKECRIPATARMTNARKGKKNKIKKRR